jgi:tripartite-type tricarboxylate transporter receptor subunit TctC
MNRILKTFAIASLLATPFVHADGVYPNRAVTIVVPYSAGQIDVFTRALAKGLSDEWKQPVVVDNRAGGNEVVGADAVARAAPNGYTILIGTESSYILNPLLFKKLSYNPDTQLAPVSIAVRAPFIFLASPGTAANNLKEFVEMARSRAGNPVRYGSSGAGGVTHLPYAKLARDNKLELIHIPYKGGAAVLQDLMGNTIESALLGAGLVAPHVKAGKVKALAVSATMRISAMPDVPTMEEQGIADINAGYILGVSVPMGTPQAVIQKIETTVRKVVTTPEFKAAYIEPMGFSAIGSTPKAFFDYIQEEKPRARARIQDAGIEQQ